MELDYNTLERLVVLYENRKISFRKKQKQFDRITSVEFLRSAEAYDSEEHNLKRNSFSEE